MNPHHATVYNIDLTSYGSLTTAIMMTLTQSLQSGFGAAGKTPVPARPLQVTAAEGASSPA